MGPSYKTPRTVGRKIIRILTSNSYDAFRYSFIDADLPSVLVDRQMEDIRQLRLIDIHLHVVPPNFNFVDFIWHNSDFWDK